MNATTERTEPRIRPSRYWPTPAGRIAAEAVVRLARLKLAALAASERKDAA